MEALIIAIFVIGYIAITLEHPLRINKSASALLTGVLVWVVWILMSSESPESIVEELNHHLSEASGILFFLLAAMTIVELIDAHDGFTIITSAINTRSKSKLLWVLCIITFFLSAVLDNLTSTIVMISLARKIIEDKEDRMMFAGMIVIAANAGGAWSPIGDVTTTMLWIGGQITATNIITTLFFPSVVCLIIPLFFAGKKMKGNVPLLVNQEGEVSIATQRERNAVFFIGVGSLLFVPIFKMITHLPPFMGILFGLGVLWATVEFIHRRKEDEKKEFFSVSKALQRVDTPSVLFFLGILIAIGALESTHILSAMAQWMNDTVGNLPLIVTCIGFLSAIVDNVPLVAASMGMYDMVTYPPDHFLWEFMAYCAGTGGSMLIIGSAAGVAAMGMENISFVWYIKKISGYAFIGYLAGAGMFLLMHH
ncbi:MAG: sodium:proton antiporter NhaD [Bacteroidetes bacterium]|nr:sodium:proton antiporter NhaD [Bacteroidota bacterium]